MTDGMLEKVRKLLAKAEDPGCTPEEAAMLNDKAAELIAKYGIDRAALAASGEQADVVGDRTIHCPAPYAVDKAKLLHNVADPMRVHTVRHGKKGNGGYDVHMFGFESDLERVELLFTSLLVQASYGMAAAHVPYWENVAAYRRSWLEGFTSAVRKRIEAAEQRAVDQHAEEQGGGTSMALVLVTRKDQVDRRVASVYPKTKNLPPRRLAGSGRSEGHQAGLRADLGGTRVGSSTNARGIGH